MAKDNLYPDSYFENRKSNDKLRHKSFLMEKKFIKKYFSLDGTICDVGCSTGEFLKAIKWKGKKYGMEVNKNAIKHAKLAGISFNRNILTETDFFDIVCFRGTIQHLPNPFEYINAAYKALKPGGFIVFLATPNANSWAYKFFNDLPALNSKLNYFIPSDISLSNILKNHNFEIVEINFPYLCSPYSSPLTDYFSFFRKIIFRSSKQPKAFHKNMMNLIAKKSNL